MTNLKQGKIFNKLKFLSSKSVIVGIIFLAIYFVGFATEPKVPTQGKISKLEVPNVLINLSDIIPVVVGHEVNIYFNNIMCLDDSSSYQFNVICTKGMQQVERWTFVPELGDIGDIPITIEVYKNYSLIGSVNSIVRVVEETKGAGQTLKVNIIGDSTTANNIMINELAHLFSADSMHISFVGTQGASPNLHEGYGGKTTDWLYTDSTSPFVYSNSFNYGTYLSTHSLPTPDIVILNLGINDIFTHTDDKSTLKVIKKMITQYDAMIAKIKLSNPSMKFGVCVTVPSGSEDAFGDYKSDQTSWRYNRNNRLLTDALINHYKSKQAQNIYCVPININLDTVNNTTLNVPAQINSRYPSTIQRQTNGVHPGPYGYYQIADVDYYWLKSMGN